jgi:hypothetical protein
VGPVTSAIVHQNAIGCQSGIIASFTFIAQLISLMANLAPKPALSRQAQKSHPKRWLFDRVLSTRHNTYC